MTIEEIEAICLRIYDTHGIRVDPADPMFQVLLFLLTALDQDMPEKHAEADPNPEQEFPTQSLETMTQSITALNTTTEAIQDSVNRLNEKVLTAPEKAPPAPAKKSPPEKIAPGQRNIWIMTMVFTLLNTLMLTILMYTV